MSQAGSISSGGGSTASGTVVQQVRAKLTGTTTVAANFFGPGAPTTADMALLISAAITPQDSANILIFDFFASGSCDSPPDYPLIAIFQSGVANAIFANNQGVANAQYTFSPKYYMTAGTTSATTFSVYHSSFFGQNFNYNDVISSIANVTFIITEVLP